jgi:hypothetical protein
MVFCWRGWKGFTRLRVIAIVACTYICNVYTRLRAMLATRTRDHLVCASLSISLVHSGGGWGLPTAGGPGESGLGFPWCAPWKSVIAFSREHKVVTYPLRRWGPQCTGHDHLPWGKQVDFGGRVPRPGVEIGVENTVFPPLFPRGKRGYALQW